MNAVRFALLSGLLCLSSLDLSFGRQSKTSDPVVSPVVSLSGKYALREAVAEVRRQTGINVGESLGDKVPEVALDLNKVSFWRAIDSLALASKSKAVQSGRDGSVTLQPMSDDDRRPPVSYDGSFRTRAVRITSSRELDSDRGSCVVSLDVTWTPTVRPLFLDGQARKVRLFDENGKEVPVSDEGSSLAPVDGRFSQPLEVTLPTLPREHRKIGSLEGSLLAIAPSKMIRFSFDSSLEALSEALPGGDQRRVVLEKVECQVKKIVLGRESWSVQIALDYPEGNHKLESFQAGSIVLNNELVLSSKDGKRRLLPTSSVVEQAGSRRAVVTYHFTDKQGAQRGKASDWKLSYTAPARVVEVSFRFAFKDLPLP